MKLLVDNCKNCPCCCATMSECMLADQLELDIDEVPVCSNDELPGNCPLLKAPLTIAAAIGPQTPSH